MGLGVGCRPPDLPSASSACSAVLQGQGHQLGDGRGRGLERPGSASLRGSTRVCRGPSHTTAGLRCPERSNWCLARCHAGILACLQHRDSAPACGDPLQGPAGLGPRGKRKRLFVGSEGGPQVGCPVSPGTGGCMSHSAPARSCGNAAAGEGRCPGGLSSPALP